MEEVVATPTTNDVLVQEESFAASFARGSGGRQPRPQQTDCIRAVVTALRRDCEAPTPSNYLIQHATGAGKTFTIAALAHALCTLEDTRKNRFALVLVVTDRKALDEQVGDVVEQFFERHGASHLVERATSCDNLRSLLRRRPPCRSGEQPRTRVVISTFQKAAGRGGGDGDDVDGAQQTAASEESSSSGDDEVGEEDVDGGDGVEGGIEGGVEGGADDDAPLVESRSACSEHRVVIIADEAHRSHGN